MSAIAIAAPLISAVAADTAAAGCRPGYVWRDAKDGDGVCVTPEARGGPLSIVERQSPEN